MIYANTIIAWVYFFRYLKPVGHSKITSNLHKKLPMPPIDDNVLSKLKATLPKETARLSSSYLDNEVSDIVYDGQYLKYSYDQIDTDDILDFAEKKR